MVTQATPHYEAKRMGDAYVLVPKNQAAWAEHPKLVLGGAALVGLGWGRGGLVGLASVLVGAGLIYRGVSGNSPLDLLGRRERVGEPLVEGGPQQAKDGVEEASMESFPASDAPARHSSDPTGV